MSALEDSDSSPWDDPNHYIRFLTAAVPVLLAYIDSGHRYRFANDAYAGWFERSLTDVIGSHVREVIGEKAYEAVIPFLDVALAGMPVTFEREMPYTGIESRFVHITFVPDARGGKVHGLYAAVTDITDRKRAEDENNRTQEEMALVIAGARCLLWHSDVFEVPDYGLHWETRFADEKAAQANLALSVPPGEDFAAAWHRSRLDEDRARDDADAARHVRNGADYSTEFRCRRADGSVSLDEGRRPRPTRRPGGPVATLIGVSTDITAHKRLDAERERLLEEEREGAVRQRAFLRDVLASVTGSRLHLCDGPTDLPDRLRLACDPIPLSAEGGLRELRRDAREAAQAQGFPEGRGFDLALAVGEAGMNAIVHAGRGVGAVRRDGRDRVQVWIEDSGAGIALADLPNATLKKGFTTAGSMGYGMKMMLQVADRIFLLTNPSGTTIVLEQDREPPQADWFADNP